MDYKVFERILATNLECHKIFKKASNLTSVPFFGLAANFGHFAAESANIMVK